MNITDPLSRIGGYINATIPGTDYMRAQRVRRIIQRKIDAMFEEFLNYPAMAKRIRARVGVDS